VTEYEKASLLAQERTELREEMVVAQKSLHSVLLGFATIIAAALGLVSTKDVGLSWLGPVVSLALSQLEFLLCVYAASLILGISAHAAYVRFIEDKINDLAQEKLLLWESEVGANDYSWPAGIFRWTVLGMGCVLIAVYIALLMGAALLLPAVPVYLGGLLEILLLCALLCRSVNEKDRLYKRLRRLRATKE